MIDAKLHARCNKLIGRFVRVAAKHLPPGRKRMATVWIFCRTAHDRATSDPERRFWKEYMAKLDERDDELIAEADRRALRMMLGLRPGEYEALVDDPIRKKVLS